MRGRVWEKSIAKAELDGYVNSGKLISNKLVAGKPIIHLLNDGSPGEGFITAEPSLEDVFFGFIHASNQAPVNA